MSKQQRNHCAFLYVIQAGGDGPIKIGWARDPAARLRALQTGNPQRLRLLHQEEAYKPSWAIKAEADLHEAFAQYRMVGEWFRAEGRLAAVLELVGHGVPLISFAPSWHAPERSPFVG